LGLEFIQAPEKKEVGHLLNDKQRIAEATGPESFPDPVNFGTKFSSDHIFVLNVFLRV